MWIVSLTCLAFVALACIYGTLSRRYDDNFLQRTGMAMICFGVSAKFEEVWRMQTVSNPLVFGHVGLVLFILGIALKIYMRKPGKKERALKVANCLVRRALGVPLQD